MEIEESETSNRGETIDRISAPLPHDVIARIEFLAIRNLVSQRNKDIHKELLETDIFLTIVDSKTWHGQDYSFAYRIPPLVSGTESDFNDWSSDSDGEGNGGGGGGGQGLGGSLDAAASLELLHLLQGWQQIMGVQLATAAAAHRGDGQEDGGGGGVAGAGAGAGAGVPAFPHHLFNGLAAASAVARNNQGNQERGEEEGGEDSIIANPMANFPPLGDEEDSDDGNDGDIED